MLPVKNINIFIFMTDHTHTAAPSGISKHLYSTNPDAFSSENIYSEDTTSKNKDESYQTMEGRTVPGHTDQKINPFNVKGVPRCKSCGGSGWKESARHPHPCNECAKKTVPNIDTYVTKVGQTATPVSEEVIIQKTIPVTEYVEQQKVVPVKQQIEVTTNKPVTTNIPVTEDVPVRREVPVTREVERTQQIPVTRTTPYTENVRVQEKIPRTSYEEIVREVPVTKMREETTTIPMTTTTPQIEEREYLKEVPINQHQTITEQVPYRENIPVKEMTEITRTIPTTSYVDVTKEMPTQTTIKHHNVEVVEGHTGATIAFRGLPDCNYCYGEGIRKSKLTGRLKPCKYCVKATGNCPLCGNTGWRSDLDKKCSCIYAK